MEAPTAKMNFGYLGETDDCSDAGKGYIMFDKENIHSLFILKVLISVLLKKQY